MSQPPLPKVSGRGGRAWLAEREAELLPVPYYHLVFTAPAAVADIAYQNKATVYDLLFKASSETLMAVLEHVLKVHGHVLWCHSERVGHLPLSGPKRLALNFQFYSNAAFRRIDQEAVAGVIIPNKRERTLLFCNRRSIGHWLISQNERVIRYPNRASLSCMKRTMTSESDITSRLWSLASASEGAPK